MQARRVSLQSDTATTDLHNTAFLVGLAGIILSSVCKTFQKHKGKTFLFSVHLFCVNVPLKFDKV